MKSGYFLAHDRKSLIEIATYHDVIATPSVCPYGQTEIFPGRSNLLGAV